MGDVIDLKRDVCPCGWKTPWDVAIETDNRWLELLGQADLYYRCPECSRLHLVQIFGTKVKTD